MTREKKELSEIDWCLIDPVILNDTVQRLFSNLKENTISGKLQWTHEDDCRHVAFNTVLRQNSLYTANIKFIMNTDPDSITIEDPTNDCIIRLPVGNDNEPVCQEEFDGLYNAVCLNEYKSNNNRFQEVMNNIILAMEKELS